MNYRDPRATIFWDTQDPQNEGWAYRQYDGNGDETDSGPVCDELSRTPRLTNLIDQAAKELRLPAGQIAVENYWAMESSE